MPLGAASRSLKEPPGQHRRGLGWRRGPWCCDGNGPLAAARPNSQSADPPPALAVTKAEAGTFPTGLQTNQITSCLALQEVVLVSNESSARLQRKPIWKRSPGQVRKQCSVGTRSPSGWDLMGGLTRVHRAAGAGRRASSGSVSTCGGLESVGLGHWAPAAT